MTRTAPPFEGSANLAEPSPPVSIMRVSSRSVSAAEALTRRLVDLADHGRRPRCGEPGGHEMWLSDDATERAQAARWCVGCAVLVECGAAADEQGERHHVWGGVDRTPPPARPKPAKQATRPGCDAAA